MKTPIPCTLLAVSLMSMSQAAYVAFNDDFSGPLDSAWTQGSYLAGHLGISGGIYEMTALQGGGNNPKLSRSTAGSLTSSYTHEISVVLDPFRLAANPGTQSDFKWKNFGADGFMEIVLNSFGDMRMYHNDFSGGAGNIQPNTNIGISDGDVLNLTTFYDAVADTIDVTYSLNGGAAQPFYSGGGIDGPIGDTISNFVEVEVFKWGAAVDTPTVGIDEWNLIAVPEPSSTALLGLGGLVLLRRRRQAIRGKIS